MVAKLVLHLMRHVIPRLVGCLEQSNKNTSFPDSRSEAMGIYLVTN